MEHRLVAFLLCCLVFMSPICFTEWSRCEMGRWGKSHLQSVHQCSLHSIHSGKNIWVSLCSLFFVFTGLLILWWTGDVSKVLYGIGYSPK